MFLFKKKKKIIPFEDDQTEYQYNNVLELYLQRYNKQQDKLTQAEQDKIINLASTHIVYFWIWLIENNYYLPTLPDHFLNQVQANELDPNDYFNHHCNGTLNRKDIDPTIYTFVDEYYHQHFMYEYCDFVDRTLHKKVFFIQFKYEEYVKFKPIIDQQFKKITNSL